MVRGVQRVNHGPRHSASCEADDAALVATQTKPIPDADLRRIDVPTTLLWGRDDRMAPLAIAEGAAARNGWQLHVIDHAAHPPHIEQPDAFLEALAAATDT